MYAFDKMIRRRYGILRRQKNETREKDKGQGNNSTWLTSVPKNHTYDSEVSQLHCGITPQELRNKDPILSFRICKKLLLCNLIHIFRETENPKKFLWLPNIPFIIHHLLFIVIIAWKVQWTVITTIIFGYVTFIIKSCHAITSSNHLIGLDIISSQPYTYQDHQSWT